MLSVSDSTKSSFLPPGDPPFIDYPLLQQLSSSTSSLEFQNPSEVPLNLKISNNTARLQSASFQNLEILSHEVVCHTSHNFSLATNFQMADDCDEQKPSVIPYAGLDDVSKMLAALSTQITSQNMKISQEISQVVSTNDVFKQEVRSEIDELRSLISDLKTASVSSLRLDTNPPGLPINNHITSVPIVQSPSIPSSVSSTLPVGQTVSNPPLDPQAQLMSLFTASFTKFSEALSGNQDTITKLSAALSEKPDTKSEWPKFSGDSKKFRAWHLSIMAQLSLPPWVELYDPIVNDLVLTTTNSSLNGKLYSKLLLALEGNALKNLVARKHLRANGLLLFRELIQTYKPRNVPEVIAHKTSEFWGNTKRFPSESVDDYYNRFHELLDDLEDADEPISTKSAIRHFIFTLGSEFEAIQNNFRLENLPVKWNTQDWPTILILCRDYYNSIKPQGIFKRDSNTASNFDREAHQKKVKMWFMNSSKFSKEISKEQQKFPDKCIYHLSKSHSTDNCHVKKECEKSSNPPSHLQILLLWINYVI